MAEGLNKYETIIINVFICYKIKASLQISNYVVSTHLKNEWGYKAIFLIS